MFNSTINQTLYSLYPLPFISSLNCIFFQGRQEKCHDNDLMGFQCQRNENFISNAVGVTQIAVENFDENLYTCSLDVDNQNDTVYMCEQCSADFTGDCAWYDFVLSISNLVFETAVKNMWFSLPKTYMKDLCITELKTTDLGIMKCSPTSLNVLNKSRIYFTDFLDIAYVNNESIGLSFNQIGRNLKTYDVLECTWHDEFNVSVKSFLTSNVYDWSFLFVLIFIVAGGLGNVLVCLAVCLDRRLQNVTNYFLFSLAVADLLVSLFVMPLGAIPGFLGYWPLGVTWCNVYVTCDVLACSASIIHMCFISVGRYLGIRNPLKMRHSATKRLMTVKIALVWLLSMIVSSSITVLGLVNKENIMPKPDLCSINNRHFRVLGSLVVFYIPMVTMVVSYALTVQLLRRQAKLADTPAVPGSAHRRLCGRLETNEHHHFGYKTSLPSNKNNELTHSATWRVSCFKSGRSIPLSVSHPGLGYLAPLRDQATQTPASISRETASCTSRSFRLPTSSFNLRFLTNRKKDRSLSANAVANEQKASKVLGLVFFTFVLCWAPFFIINVLSATLPNFQAPDHVVDVCLWLGYVSSTINPIIYTIFNRTFRGAFLRILQCKCYGWTRSSRYQAVHGASQLCARSALPLAISLRSVPLSSQNHGVASETGLL